MTEASEETLAELVGRIQVELTGQAMMPWLIEAQLETIEDRLLVDHISLERRIGPGRFLAIGTIAAISSSVAFGLLIHPAAILAAAWKLRRLLYLDRDWRPHMIAIYVKLEGTERDVFEAIHWLSMETLVVDFDKYEARDFAGAFGFDKPDLPRIIERVGIDQNALFGALERLTRREVLKTDGQRYWIAF